MNKEQIFEAIRSFYQVLMGYRKNGVITFETPEHKLLMGRIYQQLVPNSGIDLNCSSCVLHYLNVLQSYYEREFPLYQQKHQDTVRMTFPKQEPVQEIQEEDIVAGFTQAEEDEKKAEEAKQKLSRAEIMQKAREARKK